MAERKSTKPKIYGELGLASYLGPSEERSRRAPVSRAPALKDDKIRPIRISHLAIGTNNFEAVADWWQTVLNMEPSLDGEGMRFMAFNTVEHHKIVVFDFQDIKSRTRETIEHTGMHHIAFTYASFGELAATYLRLKEEGIMPWRGINHGTSFALDYYDPDLNNCELQCSCFPSEEGEWDELNEWLATGAFNRNPIGVLFDMEDAIRAYEAGVDVREIVSPYTMGVGDHVPEDLVTGIYDQDRARKLDK
jgi:catechol 2,3-dioxygenase-like lactoylglutathione lyase family enzyme